MIEQPPNKALPQPRPVVTGKMRIDRYREIKEQIEPITAPKENVEADTEKLFSMTITGSTKTGGRMDQPEEAKLDEQFIIDLVFKPAENGLRLRPAESQLLLAYIGEILKGVEVEEQS